MEKVREANEVVKTSAAVRWGRFSYALKRRDACLVHQGAFLLERR
jgi:hypothetical protein